MDYSDKLIKALRNAGQYFPTLERHREHLEACKKAGVEPDTFESFATEVLNTPKEKREWLLSHNQTPDEETPPEAYPTTRYRQYDTPIVAEMIAGLSPRRKS